MVATPTTLSSAGSDCFLNLDEIRNFAMSQAPRLPPRGRRRSSRIGAANKATRRASSSVSVSNSVPKIASRRGSRRSSIASVTSRVGALTLATGRNTYDNAEAACGDGCLTNKISHRASTGYTVITSLIKEDEAAEGSGSTADDGSFATWFHGIMSRPDAEQRLTGKASGTFLVRVSESRVGYSLSLLSQGAFRHFMLDQDADEQYRVVGKSNRTFASLNELVAFHKTTAITERGDLLGAPCPCPAPRWDSGFFEEDEQ